MSVFCHRPEKVCHKNGILQLGGVKTGLCAVGIDWEGERGEREGVGKWERRREGIREGGDIERIRGGGGEGGGDRKSVV